MKSLTLKQHFLLLCSGAFAAFVASNAIFFLSWLAYVPLLLLLAGKNTKQHYFAGVSVGLGMSLVCFWWMLGTADKFSGNQGWYGLLITLVSIAIFMLYWVLLLGSIGFCVNKFKANFLLKAVFVASCFVLAESLLSFGFAQIPFYLYSSAYGLLANLYTIQWAAFFGLPFLVFMVILVNCLIANYIVNKQWKPLFMPIGLVALILAFGYAIKHKAELDIIPLKTVKVTIAAENIPAQLRWDEQGGNILAQRLLTLSKLAAATQPDAVLWSESAIPWTYRPDDDLLQELLKVPYPPKTTHFIGMMSDHDQNRVYNSIYGITAGGKVLGRYDKSFLLHFVESQLFGLNMPFLDLDGYLIAEGTQYKPINTPVGKAGIAICNEILKPEASTRMVKNGAEFLLNPSNDAWFKGSYIEKIHYLCGRLSAVINRKDLVLNSNNGISGYIKASGEIVLKRKSNDFFVESVAIVPNRYNNSKHYFPYLTPLVCLMIILAAFFNEKFFVKSRC